MGWLSCELTAPNARQNHIGQVLSVSLSYYQKGHHTAEPGSEWSFFASEFILNACAYLFRKDGCLGNRPFFIPWGGLCPCCLFQNCRGEIPMTRKD
jgi:hypothetical protein